jgi:hypothetical protein
MVFTMWGLARWLQAQVFTVEAPVPTVSGKYSYQQTQPSFPLSRDARLQKGELFFDPDLMTVILPVRPIKQTSTAVESAVKVKKQFSSKLLLYGVTKGDTSYIDRAVVGLAGASSKQTWLAQPGSVINGETVVKIETQGIWVKNKTGAGKVGLQQE